VTPGRKMAEINWWL